MKHEKYNVMIDGRIGFGGTPLSQEKVAQLLNKNYTRAASVPSDKAEALENAVNLCKSIVKGYPDPDITHVDFRVQVTKWAQDFLDDDAKKITTPDQSDAMPCVSCGKPSDTSTPDDAEMCWKCFGEFNAAEYDEQYELIDKLVEALKEAEKCCAGRRGKYGLGKVRGALALAEKARGA